jgi:hypothetical protein
LIIEGGRFTITEATATGIGTAVSSTAPGFATCRIDGLLIQAGTFYIALTTSGAILGGYGACIGVGGARNPGENSIGDLTIVDENFTLIPAVDAAGIGIGCLPYLAAIARLDNLTIKGGTFNITAQNGAGIGLGRVEGTTAGSGNASIGSLVIEQGSFLIRSGRVVDLWMDPSAGAGIGTGWGRGGRGTIENLVISGGAFTITAVVEAGAAIGTGTAAETYLGSCKVQNLWIRGGTFGLATLSAAAIGTGRRA